MDETMVAKLKAELVELNAKCLLARDNEIRYALQRSRLEAERAETMAKLMDAHGRRGGVVTALPYAVSFTDAAPPPLPPLRIVDDLAIAPAPQRRKVKPNGLPTTPDMIVTVLREAGRPIRPSEIASFIRQRWWAELPTKVVYTNAYRMAKDGRLAAQEGHYFLAQQSASEGQVKSLTASSEERSSG
jgi:hypothetical protein